MIIVRISCGEDLMTLTVIVDSESDSGNNVDTAVIIVRTSCGEGLMMSLTVIVIIMRMLQR